MYSNLAYIILLVIIFVLIVMLFVELTKGKVKSNTCLVGKTVLITGGNSGLGYQTALALAGRGARIIIADVEDSTESKKKIIERTGNSNVTTKIFDLGSLESVRKFAKEINDEEERLDILINNAGIAYSNARTKDGLPVHMHVNHLGPFLLTHLLVDLLKKSAPSRIIFISSLLSFTNSLAPKKLNEVIDNPLISYGNTKLCNLITSNVFAEKLKGTGVTSNAAHPGMVSTSIYRKNYKLPKLYVFILYSVILKLFGKTVYEGAQCQIQCALSKKHADTTGKFFVDCIPFPQPFSAGNRTFAGEIWKKSEELVELKPEEKIS